MTLNLRICVLFYLLFTGLVAFPAYSFAQGIIVVPVSANGQGKTEADAVRDGVLQAIAQATGQRIESRESANESANESNKGDSRYEAEYRKKVDTFIRGVSKGHKVLSLTFDASAGLFKSVVEVQVVKLQQSRQLERYRLAVVAADMPQFESFSSAELSREFVSSAAEVIVRSHKFAVLDRLESELIENELKLTKLGAAPIEESVRQNAKVAADFLVILRVSRVSRMPGQNERLSVTGRIQLLDYASGQVRYSGSRTVSGFVTASRGAMSVLSRAATVLASEMMEYGFPAEVIARSGEILTIDSGYLRFSKNDRVEVFRKGPSGRDRHTGENIQGGEELVARGVIVNANERVSTVRLVEERIPIPPYLGKSTSPYIVRLLRPDLGSRGPAPEEKKGQDHNDW